MTTPTGILFSDPQVKPLGTTGQFQAGCYLYFFVTGTTTQTNVYSDGDLTTPINQPVTADSTGRFVPIYMDPSVVYRVQMFTAGNVKIEDTDPYVPLPIPSSIEGLITDVASLQSTITTLQAAISALQASIAWSTLTGIPNPISALANSTPPDTGFTFWCDNGTWTTPTVGGNLVTMPVTNDTTLNGTLTAPTGLTAIPVNAGYTYALEGVFYLTGGTGQSLSTLMYCSAGDCTSNGGALSLDAQLDAGTLQTLCNSTDLGNAAYPGLYNESIYEGVDNALILRGVFTVPAGGTTVAFQMKLASGSNTVVKAGSFVTLTQLQAG